MSRAESISNHVNVRILGATEITVGSRRVGFRTEALFALALYLTTRAGERVPREDVLEIFWPDGRDEARRHSMRQMMYRLRLKGVEFDEDRDTIQIDPSKVLSDLRRCLDPSWPDSANPADVEAGLNLGPVFSDRLPRPFLDWFEGVRDEVRHQSRKAAMRLIANSRSQGRWADLDRWGKAVLTSDPLNEEATLARAEAAAMSGAKSRALEILDGYIAEIGEAETPVAKPARQLRKRIAERRMSWRPVGPREVTLIGREEEMSALTQAVESALQGRSRSLLLVGPSGYGKSRLLAESREYAAIRGARCVAVRAEAVSTSHPWSMFRELARALSSQPGAAGTDPKDMETIRALLRDDNAPKALSLGPALSMQDIRRCLLSLALAVADEARTLLTIDDIHNCDELSLESIGTLFVGLQNSGCVCIAAGRPGTVARLSSLHSGPRVRTVQLPPLTAASCRELAEATALAHNREIPLDEMAGIVRRCGGHPLFARELALTPVREGSSSTLPDSLADLVQQSLASQPQNALEVLRAVVLLADTATAARVRQVTGQAPDAFVSVLDTLSREGLVHLDHARALTLHDCWREAVLSAIPDAACAALALQCASVLSDGSETPTAYVHLLIARLYGLAGETERQVHHLLQSVDGLIAAGLYDSAVQTIQSLSGLGDASSVARFRVRECLCLLGLGRPAEATHLAESVWRSRLLQTARDVSEHVLAVCVAADCHIRLDRADHGPAQELLSVARNSSLLAEDRARACLWGIRMASNTEGGDGFTEFAAIARSLRDLGLGSPHAALVELIFAAEAGTAEDIAAAHERVRQVEQSQLTIWDRCLFLRCCAHAHRISGAYGEAAATAGSAFELATLYGLDYSARLSAELLCNIHLDFGRTDQATDWYHRLQATSESAIASTVSAIGHTRDRLDFSLGNVAAIESRIDDRLAVIKEIGSTQGRASELALAAAVLAQSGRFRDAMPLLESALAALTRFIGRQAADFAMDACLAAARSCGIPERAVGLARQHLHERATTRGLSVAPGFQELNSLPLAG